MIHFFRDERCARHKAEGGIEIGKDEFFIDSVAILDLAPSLERGKRRLAGLTRKLLTHVRTPSVLGRLAQRHSRSYASKSPPDDAAPKGTKFVHAERRRAGSS